MSRQKNRTPRRDFLKSSALLGAGVWVGHQTSLADEVKGKSANDQLNLASIGIGGKGDSDSSQAANHANMIAICDIDEHRLDNKARQFPKAKKFTDFRKMFDELGKQIDVVTISTPDHTHACATMMAIKLGKHVYTQKPLTHDVWEARQLRLAAREYKIASQMGNQGTASDRFRAGVELLQSDLLGAVKEVHVWTDRPTNWWPQSPDIRKRPPTAPVPSYVHWDEWIGTAPMRPYADHYYHPHNWRGWWDFGCGALGDMGCHTTNQPFMGLKLGYPAAIQAESEELNPETYPGWARVTFDFPERGKLPPVKLTWYEGHKDGKLVQPPSKLIAKVLASYNKLLASRKDGRLAKGNKVGLSIGGSIVVGERGIFYSPGDYGTDWEVLGPDGALEHAPVPQTLPRNPMGSGNNDEGQKLEWLAAAKGGRPALSNFDYSGMLAEVILLGNLAIRAGGKRLEWDGPNLKFPNAPEAEKWLKREYRQPWSV